MRRRNPLRLSASALCADWHPVYLPVIGVTPPGSRDRAARELARQSGP